jgi:hypothetical protein
MNMDETVIMKPFSSRSSSVFFEVHPRLNILRAAFQAASYEAMIHPHVFPDRKAVGSFEIGYVRIFFTV